MPFISSLVPSKPSAVRLIILAVALLLGCQLVLMNNGVGAQTSPACDDHCNALDGTATELITGAPTPGNLGTAEDVDVFTFEVAAASQDIWLYTTGHTDTIGLLFKSGGDIADPTTSIAASNDGIIVAGSNFHIGVNLEPGRYYLAVAGAKNDEGLADTGTYSIHWLNLSALPALPLGTREAGNIQTEGEIEVFKFSFTGDAQDVWLYSTGSTDTIGILYDSSDITTSAPAWIAASDDSALANGNNFYIGAYLEPGTYYLAVIGAEDEIGNAPTGPYRLESRSQSDVVAEIPQGPVDPRPPSISPNSTADGIIAPGGDADVFKVLVFAEADMVVYSTGEVDTIGTLFDADGDEIDGNDDTEYPEGDLNFFFPRTFEPGVYYIEVTGHVGRAGESVGPYRLHIDLVTDQSNSRGGAEPVALGSSAMGFISGEGDEDYFLFTAPGADHFRVYTVGPTDTVGKLEDSRGSILGANDDGQLSLGHDAFLIERYLPAGTYFVSVTGWEGETGPYRLVVETATDPGDSTGGAQDLELGVPVISRIGAGDVDFFKLTLDEKTEVAFFAAGDTDTRATLLQGDGDTVVGHDDDSGEGLNFLIHTTLAGVTYYLRVEGYDNDVTGSYVLLVKPLVPLRTIGSLPGKHEVGSIGTGHDQDLYQFTLTRALPIWIYTTGLVDSVGTLYNGNFEEIASNDDLGLAGLARQFSIREDLAAGTYYVRVSSYGTGTGGYALHVHDVAEPGNGIGDAAPLELGVPLPGTIHPNGDADYFRFSFDGNTHNFGPETYFLLDVISAGGVGVEGEVLDSRGRAIDVNMYTYDRGFLLAENFPSGTYYLKVAAPRAPVPYTVIVLPHSRYAGLAADCSVATAGLTDPSTNAPRFGDDYYSCQWHLKNREPLQVGEDANVEGAWQKATIDGRPVNGAGVNVVVVDDGMDHRHEDLAPNVDRSRNYDYSGGNDIFNPSEHHGTIVSGILAASDNNMGVRGVAPRATLYGRNFLAAQTDFALSDSMARGRETTAVSNNSWGPVDGPGLGSADTYWEEAVKAGTREGYGGKGTFYVFAAGNGGNDGDDANLDEFANFYAVTSACSVNGRGERSNISEFGSSLWICAPGGDTRDGYRGLVSVDNSDRYRNRFHGTSGSAPIISGVAALLRQVNPELTWRDIKLILAESARKNDPDNPGWEYGAPTYGSSSVMDAYSFNHAYGFGVVDASAAVDLAFDWETLPPLQETTTESFDNLSLNIPLNGSMSYPLTVNTGMTFTEFVEVNAHFRHPSFRDMEIELVSPWGETSKLLSHYESEEAITLSGEIRLGSAKHLGEAPGGEWTLRITDRLDNGKSGTLESWAITVYGHSPTPGVPINLAVTPGAEALTATWDEPRVTRGAITSYDLRYTRTGGRESILVENLRFGSGDRLSHTITGLAGGTAYEVGVRANTSAGKGPWSGPVGATTLSATNTCADGEVLQGLAVRPDYLELVNDCDVLLAIGNTLSGPGLLNWSTGLDFDDWEGVTAGLPSGGTSIRVTGLELGGKSLGGRFPARLGDLTGLQTLDLSGNGLTGMIPAELGNLKALTELDLSDNQLESTIPEVLGGLTVLETLDLSRNNLSGVVPHALGALAPGNTPGANPYQLTTLRLNGNQLSGTVPATLGSLSTLRELDLSDNNLAGTIPIQLGELGSLQQLLLSGNELSGEIPAAVLTLASLQRVDLSDNLLTAGTGQLPVPSSENPTLEFLDLSRNQLSGAIPVDLSNWRRLAELRLGNNHFSGELPASLNWGTFSRLELLDFSGNQFTGPIPSGIRAPSSLRALHLNGNEFAENISGWGDSLSGLEELFVAQNAKTLTGCIPGSLRNVPRNDLPDLELPYCDLFLTGLSLEGAVLKDPPAFNASILSYVAVAGPPAVTIIPIRDPSADVGFQYRDVQDNVLGDTDAAGPGHQVHLGLGATTVNVVVVSPDNKAERVYQVRFERAGIPDAPVVDPGAGATEGDRSLGVTWKAPANDGGYRIISYDLRYIEAAATSRDDQHWTLVEGIWESKSGGPLQAIVEQMVSGEAYDLQVRAFNGSRYSAWSSPVRGTPRAVSCGASAIGDPNTNRGLVSDCEVLLAMRDTLAGSASLNWAHTEPITAWDGVTTGGATKRVTGLRLSGKNLDGHIPAAVGRLGMLTTLDLSDNNLTGHLPPQLATLTALTTLNLGDDPETGDRNQLTGPLPSWLGQSSQLVTLDLSGNAFRGTVPSELGDLDRLSRLNLSGNRLEGEIPSSFAGPREWWDLDLSGNKLTGSIPQLRVIYSLNLSDNQLTGNIPSIGSSSGPVELVDLSNNGLTGPIPGTWGTLSEGSTATTTLGDLRRLRLAGNGLTGGIPAGVGNMTSLRELDLGGNDLSGNIPSLTGLTALQVLLLNDNALAGVVPAWIPSLTGLKEVNLGGNRLTGEVPSSLGTLAGLINLNLSNNRLTGQVPGKLAGSRHLEMLLLGGNNLSGEVPGELGALASLAQLDLSENALSGNVPEALGSARALEELRLNENSLTGPIPAQLGTLSDLVVLDLGGNKLSGAIPAQLGSLHSLEVLDLHDNGLAGPIPTQLGDLRNLEEMVLSENQLSGPIPGQLGLLTNLEELSLGDNGLTGTIPPELGGLTNLQSLDLHHNGLTGSIPKELANLTELRVMLLALLDLSGEPPDLSNLVNLERLYFWGSGLEGPVPPWIEGLSELSHLFLRDNRFSGPVPAWLADLPKLSVLYLANNNLTGCMPAELETLANEINNDLGVLGLPFCPEAPLISAVTRSPGTLTVHWSVTKDPDDLVDHFSVRHIRSDAPEAAKAHAGNWTVDEVYAPGPEYAGDPSSTITGLSDGVEYDIQVGWVTADNLRGPWSPIRVGTPGPSLSDGSPAADLLIMWYDANANGIIERSEIIAAINDYLGGVAGITRAGLIWLIGLYLDGLNTGEFR